MNIFFGSIAKSHIQSPIKSLWWSLFAKIVNNFQLLTFSVKKPHHKCQIVLSVKKKERNYPTLFYIILHDFKNYPAFVDITLCIINQQEYINIIREMFFFLFCIVPYVFLHSFAGSSFVVVALDRIFFICKSKKVVADCNRQVVLLYSNNCMGICLGGLSIAHPTEVVV